MICPNCSFPNPESANYCQNCGKPLPKACPNCGKLNPGGAKYCTNCGFALSGALSAPEIPNGSLTTGISLTLDPRMTRLAAATPAHLAEKLRATSHPGGERRVVTALFADVVGSTTLAGQMDPEDWTVIMNQVFDLVVPAIYRYEGTIARFMGDALLAFFGAPLAHEDDPLRAVRAGLDLIAIVQEFSEDVRRQHGIDFAMRVGLNTGAVVVGEVGSNLIYEYTAMGDAVNLAARMQSAARPMTVLISDNTYRFVAPFFDFRDLGEISVKGKSEPIRVFEVTGIKTKPGSLRGLSGLYSPMIGRSSAMDALRELAQAVQSSHGGAGLIVGEAGVGKSRLVAEWKAILLADDARIAWYDGRALSYGQGVAYHVVIDLLHSIFGVSSTSGERAVHAALRQLCDELFGERADSIYPYLGHLLSVHLDEPAQERIRLLDPQTLQSQYLFVLRELIGRLASLRSTILVMEDLHWIDRSSAELISKLVPLSRDLPVLFIFITRPDRESTGWRLATSAKDMLGSDLVEIEIQPLGELDSEKLVKNLLDLNRLPDNLRATILGKAEGNPFFVEEIIRMLIDQGVVLLQNGEWSVRTDIGSTEIPDNLQGLLLARIDRLPEDVKQTLRVASVIGRQFPLKVLEQVLTSHQSISTSELSEHLLLLTHLGFVHQVSLDQGAEYSFTSTLVYEAARSSLVKHDRRALHLIIGETLEELYPENTGELAPLLADHFHHAREDRRAMLYYTMSGNLAFQRFANTEAARYFSSSLAIARSVFRQGSEAEQAGLWNALGELYHKRGQALWWSGSYNQAVENYREMEHLAQSQGDRKMELACLADLAQLYSTPNPKFDAERGEQLALQAQRIARELQDHAMEARILWILMANGFFSNQPQKAEIYGEQSLALARQDNLKDQLALTLADLTKYVYTPQMKLDRALSGLEEVKTVWQAQVNSPRLADTLLSEALIYVNLGDFSKAEKLVDEGVRMAQTIGSLWHLAYGWMIQGQIHVERGEYSQAASVLDESYRTSELSGFLPGQTIVNGLQSVMLMRLGALAQAVPYSYFAVKTAEIQAPFWLCQALGSQALLFLELGDFERAEAAITRSHLHSSEHFLGFYSNYIPMAESQLYVKRQDYRKAIQALDALLPTLYAQQAHGILPYFLYYKGVAYFEMGNLEDAQSMLNQACELSASIPLRWPWWQSLALLAKICAETGHPEAASDFLQSARAIIEFIAEHAGTPEMQRLFLELPVVQEIISQSLTSTSGQSTTFTLAD